MPCCRRVCVKIKDFNEKSVLVIADSWDRNPYYTKGIHQLHPSGCFKSYWRWTYYRNEDSDFRL